MYYLSFICGLCFLSNPSLAQSNLLIQLADRVCSCMETNDRTFSPAEQARECVRLVGLRHKKELLEELSLNPEKPEELNLFSERVAEQLSQDCPVLSTLRLDDFEREFRWSDRNTVREADVGIFRYKSPKDPPADSSNQTVSEPPAVWRITGTVVGRPRRGTLQLRLPDGKVRALEFPAAVSRRTDLVENQSITVICERQWRKVERGGTVVLVVRSIE